MHKNALFFEKNWNIVTALGTSPPNLYWPPTAWGSTPETLLPSPFTVTFLKRFVALTLLASKWNKKNLEISPTFCFCHSFLTSNSAQGTLTSPLAQISRHRKNFDLYYIVFEWRLVGPSPSLPPPPPPPPPTPTSHPPPGQFYAGFACHAGNRKNLIITCSLVKFCFIVSV